MQEGVLGRKQCFDCEIIEVMKYKIKRKKGLQRKKKRRGLYHQRSIKCCVRIKDLNIASRWSQRVGGALNSKFGEIYKGRSSE